MQGATTGFAQQLDDCRRDPDHSLLEMARSRVFGILAGYEDQNDHDALRSDAVFKLLADRLPEDDDLASQPTLSRFENSVTPRSLLGLEAWFLDRFVNSFDEPPREVTLGFGVDLQRIVGALREKFPGVLIRLRADSGYAKPWLYQLCEQLGVECRSDERSPRRPLKNLPLRGIRFPPKHAPPQLHGGKGAVRVLFSINSTNAKTVAPATRSTTLMNNAG